MSKTTTLKEIKNELKEKEKYEKLGKKNLHALEQAWLRDNSNVCIKCGRAANLSVDHIVPKDLMKQFGIDTDRTFIEENLQVLCRPCNHYKSNRLDFAEPKTKELIIKMLHDV